MVGLGAVRFGYGVVIFSLLLLKNLVRCGLVRRGRSGDGQVLAG
jgi:hypothetical protein